MQRAYDEERTIDETLTVLDGDTVLVPRGYHAVSAPPGYGLYFPGTKKVEGFGRTSFVRECR